MGKPCPCNAMLMVGVLSRPVGPKLRDTQSASVDAPEAVVSWFVCCIWRVTQFLADADKLQHLMIWIVWCFGCNRSCSFFKVCFIFLNSDRALANGPQIETFSRFSGEYLRRCWMRPWCEARQPEWMYGHWQTMHWCCYCLFAVYFVDACVTPDLDCLMFWL